MTTPTASAAVIYCPALTESDPGKAIDGMAQRLARSLDYSRSEISDRYVVRNAAPQDYGNASRTEVREIVCVPKDKNPETEGVVTHRVYLLDYLPLLDAESDHGFFRQVADLLVLGAMMLLRFLGAMFGADSLGVRQKLSVFIGGLALGSVVLYLALLVGGLLRIAVAPATADGAKPAATQTAPATDAAGAAAAPTIASRFAEGADAAWRVLEQRWPQLASIAGLLGITAAGLRRRLEAEVVRNLRFFRYVEQSDCRASCVGRFNALLEHALEAGPARVDVIAYSLGSMVALDALFPAGKVQSLRRAKVTSLTTIGCPFDFVRTFWNGYFDGRDASGKVPEWRNVYSPVDLLGSNFSNADGEAAPTHGINASQRAGKTQEASSGGAPSAVPAKNIYYDAMNRRELSLFDVLTFTAWQAHGQYWVEAQPDADSCFKVFVTEVYP